MYVSCGHTDNTSGYAASCEMNYSSICHTAFRYTELIFYIVVGRSLFKPFQDRGGRYYTTARGIRNGDYRTFIYLHGRVFLFYSRVPTCYIGIYCDGHIGVKPKSGSSCSFQPYFLLYRSHCIYLKFSIHPF